MKMQGVWRLKSDLMRIGGCGEDDVKAILMAEGLTERALSLRSNEKWVLDGWRIVMMSWIQFLLERTR